MASSIGIKATATTDKGGVVERIYYVGAEPRIIKDIKAQAYHFIKYDEGFGSRIATITLTYGVSADANSDLTHEGRSF